MDQRKKIRDFIELPRHPATFKVIGQCDIVRPNVELPFSESQNAAENRTAVNADSHVEVNFGHVSHVPNSLDHVQTHLHAAMGVIIAGLWQPGNAVVTVAQQFDSKAVILG